MKAFIASLLAGLATLGLMFAVNALAAPVNFRSLGTQDGGTSIAVPVPPKTTLLVNDCTADYAIKFGAAGTSPVCSVNGSDCFVTRGRGAPSVPAQSFSTGSSGAVAIIAVDGGGANVTCKLFQDSSN